MKDAGVEASWNALSKCKRWVEQVKKVKWSNQFRKLSTAPISNRRQWSIFVKAVNDNSVIVGFDDIGLTIFEAVKLKKIDQSGSREWNVG